MWNQALSCWWKSMTIGEWSEMRYSVSLNKFRCETRCTVGGEEVHAVVNKTFSTMTIECRFSYLRAAGRVTKIAEKFVTKFTKFRRSRSLWAAPYHEIESEEKRKLGKQTAIKTITNLRHLGVFSVASFPRIESSYFSVAPASEIKDENEATGKKESKYSCWSRSGGRWKMNKVHGHEVGTESIGNDKKIPATHPHPPAACKVYEYPSVSIGTTLFYLCTWFPKELFSLPSQWGIFAVSCLKEISWSSKLKVLCCSAWLKRQEEPNSSQGL